MAQAAAKIEPKSHAVERTAVKLRKSTSVSLFSDQLTEARKERKDVESPAQPQPNATDTRPQPADKPAKAKSAKAGHDRSKNDHSSEEDAKITSSDKPAAAEAKPAVDDEPDSTGEDVVTISSDKSDKKKDGDDAAETADALASPAVAVPANQTPDSEKTAETSGKPKSGKAAKIASVTLAPTAVDSAPVSPDAASVLPGDESTDAAAQSPAADSQVPAAAVKSKNAEKTLPANQETDTSPRTDTPAAKVTQRVLPGAAEDTGADDPAAVNDGTSPVANTDEKPVAAPSDKDIGSLSLTMPATDSQTQQPQPVATAPVAIRPQLQFAAVNHDKIVTGIQTQLLPNGGTMHIRLDPPLLGPLQVSVHMRDGVLTAAFETQNDEATRLLSHSLGQLKTALESQGVSVDKLQVQQAPKDQPSGNNSNDPRQQSFTQGDGLFEQQQRQRQRLLQRMWNRMNGDPLDLVA